VRKLLAVAAREIRERWILFPASLALGFNPLVLPAFGVDRRAMPEVGLMTSILLGAGAAVVMGATMLARDTANGRLGFLFSRPLPWPTIWGGKWLAAVVLVFSSGLLAAIPWMTAFPLASIGGHHGDSWIRAMLDGPGSAFLLVVVVLVVGVVNFGATAFRSRSPWFALDLVLLLAALWATRRYVAPLLLYGVLAKEQVPPTLLLLPLALALLLGSVTQVAVGRTDPRRAHGAMSLAFWALVGLTLVAAAGYWQWVRSAGPADVSVRALTSDPAGRFIYVEGSASHGGWYPYGLLIDTVGGRWTARPEPDLKGEGPSRGMLFSADGRFAALPGSDGRGAALVLFDLTANPPRATRVSLESTPPPGWRTSFALSPSADAVLVAHESGASIFALPSGRRVSTTTITPGWRPAATRFVGRGAARVWLCPWNASAGTAPQRAEMRVVDLAADGHSTTSVFPIATPFDLPFRTWGAVLPDADGQRLITSDAAVHLREGSTGALLATLAESTDHVTASFLSDGRVVVAETRLSAGDSGRTGPTLRVFGRDGARLSEMPLDLPPPNVRVGPEVAPGRVLVSSFRLPFLADDTLVVDVAASRVVERLTGLRPVLGFSTGPSASTAGPGLGSVQFLRDATDHVIRIDFASGARTTVTGPGAPRGERIHIGW
jgi:hypothetical protein